MEEKWELVERRRPNGATTFEVLCNGEYMGMMVITIPSKDSNEHGIMLSMSLEDNCKAFEGSNFGETLQNFMHSKGWVNSH